MIVFQTPTHIVIISNLGWCFFVENSVETFKDVAKVEHLWKKKRKQFWKTCHNKTFGFCQRKKSKSLFSKRFVSNILCPRNKKNFSENFFFKKQVLTLLVHKKKKKTGLYLQSFDLNAKTLLILFEAKFAHGQKQNREHLPLKKKSAFLFCLFQSCFFLPSFKMKETKNKQTRSDVFFSFCQDNNVVVQDNKNIFLFHNCPKINKPLV